MISYRSNSRYPYNRSVRSSSYYQPRKYNSGYPETFSKYQQLIAFYHLAKVSTFSPKVTVNKLKFWCNKKFSSAALNPIAAFNLERLLSERLRYITSMLYLNSFCTCNYTGMPKQGRVGKGARREILWWK